MKEILKIFENKINNFELLPLFDNKADIIDFLIFKCQADVFKTIDEIFNINFDEFENMITNLFN